MDLVCSNLGGQGGEELRIELCPLVCGDSQGCAEIRDSVGVEGFGDRWSSHVGEWNSDGPPGKSVNDC